MNDMLVVQTWTGRLSMTDELQIWALDGAGEATQVEPTNRAESELALEETLVNNPEMLMPDLELVGRQTPTDGGPLDLLGVDGYGQLAVFELKRGTLTREAVTQVVDYGSFLESMSDAELAEHIAVRSGNLGIEAIEDFEDWHRQRFPDQQLASLRPVRMALVGLGADERATRMVDFLSKACTYPCSLSTAITTRAKPFWSGKCRWSRTLRKKTR